MQTHGPLFDMRALGFKADEVVTVTGGGSGIGKATVLAAAQSGLAVSIWDINMAGAEETAKEVEQLGGKAIALSVDVTDPDAIEAAWKSTIAFGTCRYLVNNAGPPSTAGGPFVKNLEIALGSMELVTMRWLETQAEQATSIVNLASIAGNYMGGGGAISSFYPAAKAGVVGYTRYLATRFGGKPRANAVAPGMTLTPRTIPYFSIPAIAKGLERIPAGRAGYPEEIAAAILFLLSPASSYINGALLPVDGGWALS
ncbi:SDR family NAD(P)-dependent oxidoreductase [Sphingosinithalassobacter portus]|uniref:SDR family NAD(P)-dependent oxidoreductase n=1 Tax=Stakelama portus TaxID=2676234 RepID=UPI00137A2C81|nr:SDR family oxidoreductase [Sphingosinithalassobacter portus]